MALVLAAVEAVAQLRSARLRRLVLAALDAVALVLAVLAAVEAELGAVAFAAASSGAAVGLVLAVEEMA